MCVNLSPFLPLKDDELLLGGGNLGLLKGPLAWPLTWAELEGPGPDSFDERFATVGKIYDFHDCLLMSTQTLDGS